MDRAGLLEDIGVHLRFGVLWSNKSEGFALKNPALIRPQMTLSEADVG